MGDNQIARVAPLRVIRGQRPIEMGLWAGALLLACVGGWFVNVWLYGAGIVVMLLLTWRCGWVAAWFGKWRRRGTQAAPAAGPQSNHTAAVEAERMGQDNDGSLVGEMLSDGRYALLLRPQIIDNLTPRQLRRTVKELQDRMALVPKGHVIVGQVDHGTRDEACVDELAAAQGRVVHVEPVLLDRYAVSNQQYQEFVDGGGYEEMAIWDQAVLAAVLDFVDSTGHPGPRFWREGHFPPGKENHPVVGVCWYEAAAYARWVGKRLPSDAEWCKAACWPVSVTPDSCVQRKFPWGNAMESQRANIWGFGGENTEPVDSYPGGASVGGIYQLIGNVWEWTSGPFGRVDDRSLVLPVPMKNIRGGSFNTYFENEATAQFQSGENPLSRKYNIGIRLALGACDLAPQAAALLMSGTVSHEVVESEVQEEVAV